MRRPKRPKSAAEGIDTADAPSRKAPIASVADASFAPSAEAASGPTAVSSVDDES